MKKLLTLSLLFTCLLSLTGADFKLIDGKKPLLVYVDGSSKPVVQTALDMFYSDMELVSGVAPRQLQTIHQAALYVGTLGIKSVDEYLSKHFISVKQLKGQWEAFKIINVGDSMLVVIGSDARGTAYGVLELSRMIGVSPWVWWADVVPAQKNEVIIPAGFTKMEKPSVQFRGIFLNDEDWGLVPWSSHTFEPSSKKGEIGAKTYAKIFDLLLRLRANTIWPAMHEKTVPFYEVKGAMEAADRYGIVVGTSHCEPLMRNNAGEWGLKSRGAFNYLTNKDSIVAYWEERLEEVKGKENFYTIGMRGVHDGKMEGVATTAEYKMALTDVIAKQRELLSKHIDLDVTQIPQAIIPYKEVLEVYEAGLVVPDDVTLVWCDDNYGYLTRLSNEAEQKRSGGSGIYYHISYWGRPHDYLWLCSTPPAQIYHEMKKAYDAQARKLWIVNVGDIKPAEYDTEFFLDLAWNIDCVDHASVGNHLKKWAVREFGEPASASVCAAMNHYYALATERKPEHIGWSQVELAGIPSGKSLPAPTEFNPYQFGDQLKNRIDRYQTVEQLVAKAEALIPENRKDAFFQLVKYPALSASLMNQKWLYKQKADLLGEHGIYQAKTYIDRSVAAYNSIKALTTYYNKSMLAGKWDGMMDMAPRALPVFSAPEVKTDPVSDSKVVVWCEGHPKPLLSDQVVHLPLFVKEAGNGWFLSIFSKDATKANYKIVNAPKWLVYTEQEVLSKAELRINFSIDWSRVKNDHPKGSFTLVTEDKSYTFEVTGLVASVIANAYEVKGVVALNASDYQTASSTNTSKTICLGHSQQAVSLPKGETLTYTIYTTSISESEIKAYLLPVKGADGGDVRVLISIDGIQSEPLSIKTSFRSEPWKQNVLRGQAVVSYKHRFTTPGKHTLSITALDQYVVVDQLLIDFQSDRGVYYLVPVK